MAATEYILQPSPPVRAFAAAAAICAISTALILVSISNEWHILVTVIFSITGVLGLALAGLGIGASQRMKVIVRLEDDGYQVRGAGFSKAGSWADVTKVTETTDGRHITIYHGPVVRTHLLRPSGTDMSHFRELLADISRRLDQHSAQN